MISHAGIESGAVFSPTPPAGSNGSSREVDPRLSTVLITNGNLLSMLSLGDWLYHHGHHLKAVVITTKLPSTKSNVTGLWKMFWRSGFRYTYFKLNTNRFLPSRLAARGMPTTIPQLIRLYRLPTDVIYADNVNDPDVIRRVRAYEPSVLLSFSATSRFSDELIEVPSRVALNVHYALLPGYAGLSPYYWYVHHREAVAGVTMHVIHSKLDAGPIICQERFDAQGITSVTDLLIRQMEMVSPVLCRFYDGELHETRATPQDLGKRTYYRHPTRQQVSDFKHRRLLFTTSQDVNRVIKMARLCRDRAAQAVADNFQRRARLCTPADLRPSLTDGRAATEATDAVGAPDARQEITRIAQSWYVPPMVPRRDTFLVYSLDFVLATLQGCIAEPQRVRRTLSWLTVGVIVRTLMALMQLVIMGLAWVPIVNWFVEIVARTFTRNAAGFFLRSCYWKARLKRLGVDTIIDQGVEIWGPANVCIGSHAHVDTNVRLAAGERRHRQHGYIVVGDHVHLGPGVHIAGRGGVEIRDFVGIMANAHLYSATGVIERPQDPGQLISMSHMAPHDQQHVHEAPILIDDFAFVGMMSRIMPGVRIGYGAIVHANCEVTQEVPAFANIGAVPRGRQIGWRRPRRRSPQLNGAPGDSAARAVPDSASPSTRDSSKGSDLVR